MPALDLRDVVTIATGVVTILTLVWSSGRGIAKLETGQGELLRLLSAVHKRLDDYGKRITNAEREHAVLVERVANLRASQRFKVQTEPPMFKEDE